MAKQDAVAASIRWIRGMIRRRMLLSGHPVRARVTHAQHGSRHRHDAGNDRHHDNKRHGPLGQPQNDLSRSLTSEHAYYRIVDARSMDQFSMTWTLVQVSLMSHPTVFIASVSKPSNGPMLNSRGQPRTHAVTFRHGPLFLASLMGHGILSDSGSKVGPIGVPLIRQRVQRGFVTWLACCALALILFAPSISRVLAHAAPEQMLGMDCPELGAHAHHPWTPGHPDIPNVDEACGYCTLMCHSRAGTSCCLLGGPWFPTGFTTARSA